MTRHNSSVVNSSSVTASEPAPDRVVATKPGDDLFGTRSVSPVTHELAENRKHADGLGHAVVGNIPDKSRGGAGSFDVGPDGVAGLAERKREEGGADVCGDTGKDYLGLVGGLDGNAELTLCCPRR